MKKQILLIGAMIALLMSSCDPTKSKEYIAAQQEIDSLKVIVVNKNSDLDSLFNTLNEIEENLRSSASKIKKIEELKREQVADTKTQKEKINEYINDLYQTIEKNKKKIESLQSQLRKSDANTKKLKDLVANYENRINEQDEQIKNLQAELEQKKLVIENLNKDVQKLTSQNEEKERTIATKIDEANVGFYILGTYKDLKDNNIIYKKGGFIGIGTSKIMSTEVDINKFTKVDVRKTNSIELGAKKARMISQHPEGSYELIKNDKGQIESIVIKNIDEFWKLTRYAIFEITK